MSEKTSKTAANALAAAATQIGNGDREGALAKLLVAWRAVRHPRIADLIDHVSDELVAAAPPIKGKTVAARTAAWHAIDKQGRPEDLGRLLATPWPGTWQHALPVLLQLVEWPDDPRLAMSFARLIDETRYPTWTAKRFYRPLFARFDELRDPRTLPIMKAQLAKEKPYYYQRDMGPLEAESARLLEETYPDGAPALEPEVAAALAAAEAPYATKIGDAQAKTKREAEHLAAIYEAPFDPELRAVYADWLSERGDPRGELIALQLARAEGRSAEGAEQRERALIAKHGRTWAGALDDKFDEHGRIFEGGFFVGGLLANQRDAPDLDVWLREPAWALVRVLDAHRRPELALALADRPELRSLRAIRRLDVESAVKLATGRPRALTELGCDLDDGQDAVPAETIRALSVCASLPKLTRLVVERRDGAQLAWLAQAPVLERVTRLGLDVRENLTPFIDELAERTCALREIQLGHGGRYGDSGWRFLIRRDGATGPFTTVDATFRTGKGSSRWSLVGGLTDKLSSIPAAGVRTITVAAPRGFKVPAAELASLAEAVARFADATQVTLPWDVAPPDKRVRETGARLSLRLDGDGLLDPKRIEKVWALTTGADGLGLVFDSFEVGYGSTLRELGDDPLVQVKRWAANARAHRFELKRDGGTTSLMIERGRARRPDDIATILQTTLGDRSPEDFVAWLVRFLDVATFDEGTCTVDGRREDLPGLRGFSDLPHGAWLCIIGPRYVPIFSVARLEKLGKSGPAKGLFVVESKRNLVIGLTARPTDTLDKARCAAVGEALRAMIDEHIEKERGYALGERVRAILGPVAKQLGFTAALAPDPDLGESVAVAWTKQQGGDELRLVVRSSDPLDHPLVYAQLHHQEKGSHGYRPFDLAAGKAATRAQLDKVLAQAAKTAREEGAGFFADPRPKKKRR